MSVERHFGVICVRHWKNISVPARFVLCYVVLQNRISVAVQSLSLAVNTRIVGGFRHVFYNYETIKSCGELWNLLKYFVSQ